MDQRHPHPAPPPRLTNYEVRYWEERQQWYVVNRETGHHVGDLFLTQGAAERWMVRCQEDYDAGRQIGERPAGSTVFGMHLRELRKRRMLTLEELAERIGSPWQTVQRWETGARFPRPDYQRRLCEALDVSADELLQGVR